MRLQNSMKHIEGRQKGGCICFIITKTCIFFKMLSGVSERVTIYVYSNFISLNNYFFKNVEWKH